MGEYSQAIPMLVKKVMDGDDPVVVWGSGRQRRNYMHASDYARVMVDLVAAGHTDGPVNVGGAETVTIRELVELICAVSGRPSNIVADPSKPEGRFVKSADVGRLCAALPDFRPRVDLTDGIRRMIEWHGRSFPDAAAGGAGER